MAERRRLPGTRWSAIRMNFRWVIQAVSLVLGIFFFMRAFDTSKTLLVSFSFRSLASWIGWVLLFVVSFFALMFTSYLKERGNRTLQKQIVLFENLVKRLRLENYTEGARQDVPEVLQNENDGTPRA
jgi:hypothetical protein